MPSAGLTNNADPRCRTFLLKGENHTLGNALRYIIMKNPEVSFCAYTLLHPTENEIKLKIQTYEIPAEEALKKGLQDLQSICSHVLERFEDEVMNFK